MKVTTNKINEIHISHLLKTSIENLTKMEAITSEPKLFWCKGILTIPTNSNNFQKNNIIYYDD